MNGAWEEPMMLGYSWFSIRMIAMCAGSPPRSLIGAGGREAGLASGLPAWLAPHPVRNAAAAKTAASRLGRLRADRGRGGRIVPPSAVAPECQGEGHEGAHR